jgi:SIT family siderophore-iron:H+ symporter-like MFS transporter
MASHDLEKTSSAASSATDFNHETAPKSFGVQKAEGAARTMSPRYIFMIFAFIALAAYIVSLDQYTAFAYETEALSTAFGQHSLIATINVSSSSPLAVADEGSDYRRHHASGQPTALR